MSQRRSLCRAKSERKVSCEVGIKDGRSRFEPQRAKEGVTVEDFQVDRVEGDCEDSYRMWEMNKQMSPSQPLLDLTNPALTTLVARMTRLDPVAKVWCQRFGDEFEVFMRRGSRSD